MQRFLIGCVLIILQMGSGSCATKKKKDSGSDLVPAKSSTAVGELNFPKIDASQLSMGRFSLKSWDTKGYKSLRISVSPVENASYYHYEICNGSFCAKAGEIIGTEKIISDLSAGSYVVKVSPCVNLENRLTDVECGASAEQKWTQEKNVDPKIGALLSSLENTDDKISKTTQEAYDQLLEYRRTHPSSDQPVDQAIDRILQNGPQVVKQLMLSDFYTSVRRENESNSNNKQQNSPSSLGMILIAMGSPIFLTGATIGVVGAYMRYQSSKITKSLIEMQASAIAGVQESFKDALRVSQIFAVNDDFNKNYEQFSEGLDDPDKLGQAKWKAALKNPLMFDRAMKIEYVQNAYREKLKASLNSQTNDIAQLEKEVEARQNGEKLDVIRMRVAEELSINFSEELDNLRFDSQYKALLLDAVKPTTGTIAELEKAVRNKYSDPEKIQTLRTQAVDRVRPHVTFEDAFQHLNAQARTSVSRASEKVSADILKGWKAALAAKGWIHPDTPTNSYHDLSYAVLEKAFGIAPDQSTTFRNQLSIEQAGYILKNLGFIQADATIHEARDLFFALAQKPLGIENLQAFKDAGLVAKLSQVNNIGDLDAWGKLLQTHEIRPEGVFLNGEYMAYHDPKLSKSGFAKVRYKLVVKDGKYTYEARDPKNLIKEFTIAENFEDLDKWNRASNIKYTVDQLKKPQVPSDSNKAILDFVKSKNSSPNIIEQQVAEAFGKKIAPYQEELGKMISAVTEIVKQEKQIMHDAAVKIHVGSDLGALARDGLNSSVESIKRTVASEMAGPQRYIEHTMAYRDSIGAQKLQKNLHSGGGYAAVAGAMLMTVGGGVITAGASLNLAGGEFNGLVEDQAKFGQEIETLQVQKDNALDELWLHLSELQN